MAIKIAFFDTKSYDRESFDKASDGLAYEIHYYKDFEDLKSIVENYINKVDKL